MLAAEIHHALRTLVFDQDGNPAPFTLRPKANTQDDPFDEWLRDQLSTNLPHTVFGASGPLISPDIAVVRRGVALSHEHPATTGEAIGIEVKKFESESARGTGLDFNSTPPCGSLTVYDVQHQPIVIPGFYLFCVLRQLAPLGA